LFLAIDIGAGQGSRFGLFDPQFREIVSDTLPLEAYGTDYPSFLTSLQARIGMLLDREPRTRQGLRGIGIASAGIMGHDGSFLLTANLPQFIGQNLRRDLEAAFGVPTGIANDADAGALAEWSVLRMELLYWVFGGGWGGAWVSTDGKIRFPSTGWDRRDESLHYTNEPGYAIPLDKFYLKTLFSEIHASYERWERIMEEDFGTDSSILVGPSGRGDCVRAESILSGPGRCRLFRAIVGNDDFYERFLDIHETRQMADPSVAGKHISKLSSMRVQAALDTDRLFGKILAHATQCLIKQARRDGLTDGVPIALGGKPSYALPYFGPSCQRLLGSLGIMSYLRPSVIDERGGNANLLGAAVLAAQVAED
jgi:hypothetical protein